MQGMFFFFFDSFSKDDKWSLLKFVVVVSNFHCTSDYTMAGNMLLLVVDSIRD
jgi:hypothetical protein